MTMGDNVERGVNFASGGTGILDATGELEVSCAVNYPEFLPIFSIFSIAASHS